MGWQPRRVLAREHKRFYRALEKVVNDALSDGTRYTPGFRFFNDSALSHAVKTLNVIHLDYPEVR
ncbi:MAG: hypothetical protein WAK12_07080 [Acidimicrobiales bacterium]